MLLPVKTILLALLLLAGCSNNTRQALYESIRTQNEVNKTPAERAITPSPGYREYESERESLKQ